MTPRLLLEPEAEAEFLEAGRWYAERNAAIAAAFRVSVERTLEAVERAPQQFPIALRDIRKALVRHFPYVVYYVVLPDVISVIAIIHGRRNPRVWQARR
jgi:plasmid stabilization system protein ParE